MILQGSNRRPDMLMLIELFVSASLQIYLVYCLVE